MVCDNGNNNKSYVAARVLILILLEYGLRLSSLRIYASKWKRLNPYSIGIWSATLAQMRSNTQILQVLILILLEYGLRPLKSQTIDFQILKI